MKTVFLSGSRNTSRLNDLIRERIQNMIDSDLRIVVGDANGADKAMQKFLADNGYGSVIVFCAGDRCRNNVGNWRTEKIAVDPGIRGREFYAQKDRAMAEQADFGFVLWDGKSAGSIGNVLELVSRGKKVVLYYSPEKQFYNIGSVSDANSVLEKCDPVALDKLSKKTKFADIIGRAVGSDQSSFAL